MQIDDMHWPSKEESCTEGNRKERTIRGKSMCFADHTESGKHGYLRSRGRTGKPRASEPSSASLCCRHPYVAVTSRYTTSTTVPSC